MLLVTPLMSIILLPIDTIQRQLPIVTWQKSKIDAQIINKNASRQCIFVQSLQLLLPVKNHQSTILQLMCPTIIAV